MPFVRGIIDVGGELGGTDGSSNSRLSIYLYGTSDRIQIIPRV